MDMPGSAKRSSSPGASGLGPRGELIVSGARFDPFVSRLGAFFPVPPKLPDEPGPPESLLGARNCLISLDALLPLVRASSITLTRWSFWILAVMALALRDSTISVLRCSIWSIRLSASWICRSVSSRLYSPIRLIRSTFSSFIATLRSFLWVSSMRFRSRASLTRCTLISSSMKFCLICSLCRSSSRRVCAKTINRRCSINSCCRACSSRSLAWDCRCSSRRASCAACFSW
mmetsp:Transcript_23711/g.53512  ORF Transcript_23711/g.53512 Transcript_23711/m.53512 type:complete len:231 (-) Transcript_23711:395-1087(-)